jgi:hypothetical protein
VIVTVNTEVIRATVYVKSPMPFWLGFMDWRWTAPTEGDGGW